MYARKAVPPQIPRKYGGGAVCRVPIFGRRSLFFSCCSNVGLLVDKKMQIPNAWICFIPTGLFYLLNCYYLGLERLCISSQKSFLKRICNNGDYIEDLYKVEELKDKCDQICNTIKAMRSISTTPFYLIVAVVVMIFWKHS